MHVPIFEVAKASAAVVAVLGANPTRLYPFGEAPAGVAYPYAVWQGVGGLPENYLGQRPDADNLTTQVDVYGQSATSVRAVADALRDAFEPVAYVVSWRGESRDPDTLSYRVGFDVAWIVQR